MDALAPAVDATTGVVANPLFKGFNPLKFMLASLGIPVDHLVEGSRKCVAELGPEAMGALKALLVICPPPQVWAPSLCLCRRSSPAVLQRGSPPLLKILQQASQPHVTETSLPTPQEKLRVLRQESR